MPEINSTSWDPSLWTTSVQITRAEPVQPGSTDGGFT